MKNIFKKIFIFLFIFTLSACAKQCGKNPNQKLSPLEIFPEQHRVVLLLNWKRFAATPYSEAMFQKASPELRHFSSQMEILYISTSLRRPGEEPSSLALVEGEFDIAKILEWLTQLSRDESKELQNMIWKGKTIYISPKDPDMGMSILNKNQIIWGTLTALKQSLEAVETKSGSLAGRKDFASLWAQHNPSKLIWGAALLKGQESSPSFPLLQNVNSLILNADLVAADLNVEVTANSVNEAEAKNLLDFLSSYQKLVSSQADSIPQKLLSQLKLEQKQQNLLATLNISSEQLKTLASQIQFVPPESQPNALKK
ncbi:MAG: hypothetical protein HQM15_11175 [Deltaproteobacteria bacterium]|nr:hypothetical protein [Deltaproteobacteria bacterium]